MVAFPASWDGTVAELMWIGLGAFSEVGFCPDGLHRLGRGSADLQKAQGHSASGNGPPDWKTGERKRKER